MLAVCSARPLAAVGGLTLCLALLLAPIAPLAQHAPTEEELDKDLSGVHTDDPRGYQQRSVEQSQSGLHRALAWIRYQLARIHVTPARLALGLGALGSLYTWGKNKRMVNWAVLAVVSWLLVIVGICAMVFHWPYMN